MIYEDVQNSTTHQPIKCSIQQAVCEIRSQYLLDFSQPRFFQTLHLNTLWSFQNV